MQIPYAIVIKDYFRQLYPLSLWGIISFDDPQTGACRDAESDEDANSSLHHISNDRPIILISIKPEQKKTEPTAEKKCKYEDAIEICSVRLT